MSTIFTQAALQHRSIRELRALFARAQRDLVRSTAGSCDRRAALSSLETISLAIAQRMSAGASY